MQEENSYMSKIKIFAEKHKSILIGSCIVVIIVGLSILTSMLMNKKGEDITKAPLPSTSAPTITKEPQSYNPLISNGEIKRVHNAYKQKLGDKYIEPPKYQFEYELSPRLKSGKSSSSLFFIKNAFSAGTCDIDSAPSKVSVFSLKSHLFKDEATAISKEFGFSVPPSSLPMEDGVSFQYFYSDSSANAFLTINEPSAIYYYHKVISDPNDSPDIDLTKATNLSDNELKKHNLSDNLNLKSKIYENSLKKFVLDYVKEPDGLKTVDPTTIKALGMPSSVCAVKTSEKMNKIQTIITPKGGLFKLINNTRIVDKSYTFDRQSLDASLEEYKLIQPIDPIVVGPTSITGGKVIIDEATLVLFDYGDQYAQVSYIPMYLTSGQSATGTRVFSLFPAVKKSDLDKTNINDLTSAQSNLQLGTFKPVAPKPQYKTPPPVAGCPGNLIDYRVTCSYNSSTVCDGYFSAQSSQDPFGVCTNGCQDKSGEVTTGARENPCEKFLQDQGISSPELNDKFKNSFDPQSMPTGGTSSCSLNGCPC